ncbi:MULTISPECIES: hypothetical protein [unclassified Meiothermus]|uniref:hypothetical protein n=1 Tax=unclassified Meiothermus TaxID=370471 RepID=UPI000D7C3B6F|nr:MULTISPECIES: hypothetical protein [unclassified Meiothermus]PZA08556.1 hypothetical protein DNA98_00450 [Meiothermus sp. Pnk-1]RYM40826.1 hypothetical protein EWH23_01490 [Meiothermus sp. PNK-Is4]
MIFPLQKAPAAGEVADLQKLQAAGLPVVDTVVLQGLEAEFYQLANLPEQIRWAFEGVFGARIDEERLEAACAQAERLVRESYLLPERAEELRRALPEPPLLVRYAGEAPFALGAGKQETLWALKRLWASRWEVDAVLERAPQLSPPEALSLLQQTPALPDPEEDLSAVASRVLGRTVRIWSTAGKIVWVAEV